MGFTGTGIPSSDFTKGVFSQGQISFISQGKKDCFYWQGMLTKAWGFRVFWVVSTVVLRGPTL